MRETCVSSIVYLLNRASRPFFPACLVPLGWVIRRVSENRDLPLLVGRWLSMFESERKWKGKKATFVDKGPWVALKDCATLHQIHPARCTRRQKLIGKKRARGCLVCTMLPSIVSLKRQWSICSVDCCQRCCYAEWIMRLAAWCPSYEKYGFLESSGLYAWSDAQT